MAHSALAPRQQLYLYFKVARPDLPAVLAQVQAHQAAWQVRWPSLNPQLMQRAALPWPEAADTPASSAVLPLVTLMEVYQLPDEPPARQAWQQALAELDRALAPWLQSPRHTECFEPCAWPPLP